MADKTLNDPFIRNYSAPEKRTEIYDNVVSGFALRVTPTGYKSFVYRYRFGNKVKRYTIGAFPKIGLADARAEARKLAYQISQGKDPLAERKKAKNKPDPLSFAELAKEYKNKGMLNLKEKTKSEYTRIIDKELIPALGKMAVREISNRDINELLDRKAYKDDAPTMANRIRARLSRIFNFGLDRGLVENNPVSRTSKFEHGENKKERFYSDKEIKKLWPAFEAQTEPAKSILKILLLTGQRIGETSLMKWENIQDEIWTIPAEDTKNGLANDVPLSPLAKSIINNMRPLTGDSRYVFESPVIKGQPIQDISRTVDKVRKQSKVNDFTPHDLRRTFTTNLAKLKINRTVAGKIINHKKMAGDDQVIAVYDRHNYIEEKREALNKWAKQLKKIITKEEQKSKNT